MTTFPVGMIDITAADIGLFAIFLVVLVLPFCFKRVECNLEIFLFVMGAAAVTIASKWGWRLVLTAIEEPVAKGIVPAVLLAGLAFYYGRRPFEKITRRFLRVVPLKVAVFVIVVVLGFLSSVITAIIAAIFLVEIANLMPLHRGEKIHLVVIACFAIGLGAVLTPIGEPLSTIAVVKLAGPPYFAGFWYLMGHLGVLIIAGVVVIAVFAAFYVGRAGARPHAEDVNLVEGGVAGVFLRAGKVYAFVAALFLLGAGMEVIIYKYFAHVPAAVLFWVNMISAVLDNATLTAAEIAPALTQHQINAALFGLLISGGMLIPGNIPNIISAGKLRIRSTEWAKLGVPLGLALNAIFFIVLFVFKFNPVLPIGRPAAVPPELAGRVVIVAVDAFDWRIFREVSRERPMPAIERLIAEGATGDLLSIEPLVSPMIWTTMATGVEPPVHGIVDFLMKDPATGEDVPIASTMRRVPALWNMLSARGETSGFIGWLGTYPAEAVKGFMVSDRVAFHMFDPQWQKGTADRGTGETAGLTYPPELMDELRPLVVDSDRVPFEAVREFIKIEPGELPQGAKVFHPLDLARNLRLALASNRTYEGIADYTYGKYRPQVFSVYLDLVDNTCHLFIKYMPPHTRDVSDQDAAKYGQAVAAAYAHTDSIVGEWLKRIDDQTTLILVSDHGFKSGDLRPDVPSVIGAVQATRWHRMAGAIAIYGKHVRKGVAVTGAGVLDITPTVLRLAGLPKAKDMPGDLIDEAFDPEWVAKSAAIGEIETYGTRKETASSPRSKQEEEAILKRLRALGYVGGAGGGGEKGGGATGAGSAGSGPSDLMKLAHSYYEKAEFDKAIEIWKRILKDDPTNAEVIVGMANALIEKGDLDGAYIFLQGVLKRDPGFLPAKDMLALYHINVGHLDQAVQLSMEVLAKDPRDAEAYFNLSIALDEQGKSDQALAALERSVALRGDYDIGRINLGNAYLKRGRLADARVQFDKALELDPGRHVTWFALGRLEMASGKPDQAIADFREALKREPRFNEARISLAIVLASQGKLADARAALDEGLAYDSDLATIHTNIGVIDLQQGNKASAEKHFKQAIEIDPKYLPARFDLAELYIAGGDKGRAADQLKAVLKIDPANREAAARLASIR